MNDTNAIPVVQAKNYPNCTLRLTVANEEVITFCDSCDNRIETDQPYITIDSETDVNKDLCDKCIIAAYKMLEVATKGN